MEPVPEAQKDIDIESPVPVQEILSEEFRDSYWYFDEEAGVYKKKRK